MRKTTIGEPKSPLGDLGVKNYCKAATRNPVEALRSE